MTRTPKKRTRTKAKRVEPRIVHLRRRVQCAPLLQLDRRLAALEKALVAERKAHARTKGIGREGIPVWLLGDAVAAAALLAGVHEARLACSWLVIETGALSTWGPHGR